MQRKEFLDKLAGYCVKYAPQYQIKVISPILAQAICELGWEQIEKECGLFPYNNFFGMKCGGSWKGKSVNMATKEEYTVGTVTDIFDNFRVYNSFEEGVHGYFEFIDWSNYANLKNLTDPFAYIDNLKRDGWATSSAYVSTLTNIVNDYNLREYDKLLPIEEVKEPELKYKVGDNVKYTKIYGSTNSKNGFEPYYNEGVITKIYANTLHPYLIGNGTGFVDDDVIIPEVKAVESIKVGDKVKVLKNINYDTGKTFTLWYESYDVLEVVDNRAVIGKAKTVTAPIDIRNIERI